MWEIAQHLGVSKKSIVRYVKEGLEKAIEDTRYSVDQYRQLELERLDKLLVRWFPLAVSEQLIFSKTDRKGNQVLVEDDFEAGLKAVAAVLKIMERRAKLLGLDALGISEMRENTEISLEQLAAQLQERTPLLLSACGEAVEEKDGDKSPGNDVFTAE